MINIETVIVSCGYSDFLNESLRENLPHLDFVVVVTCPEDEETQKVCRKYCVHYVMSNDYEINGSIHSPGTFNKGRMIRRGFDQISAKDWVMHLDADIILPRRFRRLIEVADLDRRCIYGSDRQDVVGWDDWQRMKTHAGPWDNHMHENAHWFHPKMKVSSRWISNIHGYAPIGALQLFHGSEFIQNGYHVRNYPVFHSDAARSDVQFALQWDRQKRLLIPELVVLHLVSEEAPIGANWSGRTTKPFGPEQHRPKP